MTDVLHIFICLLAVDLADYSAALGRAAITPRREQAQP